VKTLPTRWLLMPALAAGLWAAGCEDKKPPPPPVPQQAAAASAPSAAAVEESPAPPAYIYTPIGKRDPFKSAYKVIRKPGEKAPGGILTKYEIDQLKLTAIISGISRPRAQVELPDGKGVSIRVGSRIGKNFGRVVRIKHDEVIVSEDYRDWSGRKVTNYIHMKIQREKKRR
jgi:type IV pilus assembly protein PilP